MRFDYANLLADMGKSQSAIEEFKKYVFENQNNPVAYYNMGILYQKEKDPMKIHKAEAMYSMLEDISDRCREVCRYTHNIALKNI